MERFRCIYRVHHDGRPVETFWAKHDAILKALEYVSASRFAGDKGRVTVSANRDGRHVIYWSGTI